ncbi:glycosyltransferase [Ferroacidibacillus organovorans]|uniref:glycosyltransferase n=1 Tax=Ferroacidibacillus organovorans TaxID=1765683 RepID=UPI0007A871A2|nr:glycosyltransferase [Ferroacidibacillus organovorans]KYP79848.1 hypothetical protein AYJ22_13325 [Ferroacidibacillus organovorans]
MRIVIDMQGAQSASRHRGIGRLTLSLIKALVANKGDHEVILALNGLFPDTIEFIRSTFDQLLSQENIRVWQAVGPVYYLASDSSWRRRTAELIRESFLASLKPDIILITSLFEGLGDDAVTSIGAFNNTIPTAVILYDLIPLIYRELYLKSPEYELWYEQKIGHLRRADLLLSISESSRQEAIRYLGIASDSAVNISAAVDAEFKPLTFEPSDKERILSQYGISQSFVMYTGAAIEPRKNIEGLIRAYAQLPKSLRRKHQLLIVCTIQPVDRARLVSVAKKFGMGSEELVLTGYVPDEDLINLYNLCKVFIFPSWHEGFGLPVLEAMSCGTAVIGSNTSSVPEIIERKDALFDPKNDRSITDKLEQILTDEEFLVELQRHSLKQSQKFSWDLSAKRALHAMDSISEKNCDKMFSLKRFSRRPKLAYISPLPPVQSGISDYSAKLLPELARYYEIEVIVDQETVSDPWIRANCPIRNSDWFLTHAKKYDRVIYHFGNSPFHHYMLSLLNEIPGVVVLHDFFLSGIYKHSGENYLSDPRWLKELYCSHGYKAVQEHASTSDLNQIIMKYPCNLSVLKSALGLIVHSEHPIELSKQCYPKLNLDNWRVITFIRDLKQKRKDIIKHTESYIQENLISECVLGLVQQYHNVVEYFYSNNIFSSQNLIEAIGLLDGYKPDDMECADLANNISRNQDNNLPQRQLLIDISELVVRDAKSGIQRVTRSVLKEMLESSFRDYRIEPVYASIGEIGYRYARQYTLELIGSTSNLITDELIQYQNGDIFMGLDFQSHVVVTQREFLTQMHNLGVQIFFTVYDLLPILMPQVLMLDMKIG